MDSQDASMPPLGDVELDALKALWDAGPSTVRQVAEALRVRGRTMKYTTAQTHLNRLKAKGYAEVVPGGDGPALLYRAASSRDDLLRGRLRDLADQLCEGTPAPLVLSLVEGHRFTPDEIARFRALLDRHRPDAGPSASD
ncbi:BlaI/MecI/CopY family transcriptional regulator [Tundrisphaera sp. TA3]|uniref:BlaI/MecI/CopY family transcriptional regulator n=1 Tax=Tundrisphaera sp. TA3 TaxID=3435775 RepID=UPI003EC04EC7